MVCPQRQPTPHRIEIVIAILNGIVGDFLHSQDDNPLAISYAVEVLKQHLQNQRRGRRRRGGGGSN